MSNKFSMVTRVVNMYNELGNEIKWKDKDIDLMWAYKKPGDNKWRLKLSNRPKRLA
jgi:hypothetical protein